MISIFLVDRLEDRHKSGMVPSPVELIVVGLNFGLIVVG